ncbi:MAG: alpha/beta fold hydrolase [Gemmatimonadota bacterium]
MTPDSVRGRLHMRHWRRQTSGSLGTLLCVHGVSEHSGRYDRLASAVCAAGLDVMSVDLVGHGRSPGRRGHIRDFAIDHLGAVDHMIAAAHEAGLDAPLFVLGHSLGGLIAARWAQVHSADGTISGLILVTPFISPRIHVPVWKRTLASILSRTMPAFSMPTGIRDTDLFRDPADRESYAADPLVQRRISAGHWIALGRERRNVIEEAGHLTAPTLLLLAGEDRIVSTMAARELGRALPDVTVIEYAKAFHALHADPSAARVFEDLIAWVRERAGR